MKEVRAESLSPTTGAKTPDAGIALGLALTTGIMGVISPYATGAALPYYNCGYITSAEFWRNATIYGIVFLAALLVLGLPLL